ncbi:hypothetical protein JCM3765_001727 [Sporobolomyces pararoseus]
MEEVHDDSAEMILKDPDEMTAEERRQALVEAIEQDDLLGVLVYFAPADELNATNGMDGAAVLQTVMTAPTSNLRIRIFILECLLHRGYDPSVALNGTPELVKVVGSWNQGGRERALDSKHLVDLAENDIGAAEEWIFESGLEAEEEVEMKTFEPENAEPEEPIKQEEEGSEKLEEEDRSILEKDAKDVIQTDEQVSATVSQEDSNFASTSFRSLPRPLPQPPSPVRPYTEPIPANNTLLVRILHLPINLPQWKFHQFLVEQIPAIDIVQVDLKRDDTIGESIGVVQVVSAEIGSLIISKFKGRSLEGQILDALPCSSRHEAFAEEEEEDPYAPSRPPIPVRPRSPSPSFRWSKSNRRSPSHSLNSSRRSRSPTANPRYRHRSRSPTSHSRPSSPSPPRRRSRSRQASGTVFNPSEYIWMVLRKVPTDWAQRRIYDELAKHKISAHHCILNRSVDRCRTAYLAFSSSRDLQDAIEAFERARCGLKADRYDSSRFRDVMDLPYPPSATREPPYLPPSLAVKAIPPNPCKLTVKYLPSEATSSQVIKFIESRIGSGTIEYCSLHGVTIQGRENAEQLAEVVMRRKSHAIKAIEILDGIVFRGIGLRVEWWYSKHCPIVQPSIESPCNASTAHRSDRRTSQLSPRRRSRSRSPPRPKHSLSPPRPLSNGTPDTPPRRSRSPDSQLAMDLSRIRSLNLSSEDLEAIQRIWTPLEAPPRSPNQNFNREVDVNVKFGFLPRSEALSALEDKEPVFQEDPLLERRYRSFLEGQAGISRDYYTIFFAQLFDWNVHSEMFANRGREIAARRRRKGETEGRREERKR